MALRVLLFLIVTTLACLFVHSHYTQNRVYAPASLERLCQGTAPTPWQYRVLVPLIVRSIESTGIGDALDVEKDQWALGIELVCTIAFFFSLRALLARCLDRSHQAIFWAAIGFYALPFLYVFPRRWPFWYSGDIPAVLLTTLGILLIRERKWALYYGALLLATLNRETSALLILAFAVTQLGRSTWTWYAGHILAQLALWAGIKGILQVLFQENPGLGAFWDGALKNSLAQIQRPDKLALLSSLFGFLWLPLACFAWFIREPFVRRVVILVPIYLIACFSLGNLLELRIYGEALPLVVLGVAAGVNGWIEWCAVRFSLSRSRRARWT